MLALPVNLDLSSSMILLKDSDNTGGQHTFCNRSSLSEDHPEQDCSSQLCAVAESDQLLGLPIESALGPSQELNWR